MADWIVIGILIVVVGAAIAYIIKSKKRGVKCIGCPAAGNCSAKNNIDSKCGCGCNSDSK